MGIEKRGELTTHEDRKISRGYEANTKRQALRSEGGARRLHIQCDDE